MSRNTSTTRRARISRRAAIAAIATAGLGAGLAAGTGTAFAAQGPSGTYDGVVTVASALTIAPAQTSFTLTAVPGTPVSTTPFNIMLGSSDSAGYALVEVQNHLFGGIPAGDWAVSQWAGAGPGAYASTNVPFADSTTAVTIFQTGGLSGNLGTQNTGGVNSGGPINPQTGLPTLDIVSVDTTLSLPVNFPGSPNGGYTGQFTYSIIGA